jgi:hypothetical protein
MLDWVSLPPTLSSQQAEPNVPCLDVGERKVSLYVSMIGKFKKYKCKYWKWVTGRRVERLDYKQYLNFTAE